MFELSQRVLARGALWVPCTHLVVALVCVIVVPDLNTRVIIAVVGSRELRNIVVCVDNTVVCTIRVEGIDIVSEGLIAKTHRTEGCD